MIEEIKSTTTQSEAVDQQQACSAVPVSYRLPWSRYENPAPWNAVEVQATMFEEGRPTQWAIREGGCVLTKKREWEMEPMPSSRTDKFLKRSRWKTWEAAVAFAMEFHSQNDKDLGDREHMTMKTRKTTSERLPASDGYAVGLPDTQGGMCWLAGYESDPTRYYTPSCALIFKTQVHALAAIVRARKTHPGKEREYRVIPASEMVRHNASSLATAGAGLPKP